MDKLWTHQLFGAYFVMHLAFGLGVKNSRAEHIHRQIYNETIAAFSTVLAQKSGLPHVDSVQFIATQNWTFAISPCIS